MRLRDFIDTDKYIDVRERMLVRVYECMDVYESTTYVHVLTYSLTLRKLPISIDK